VPDSELV
jgi:hypothetical protein